MSRVEWGHVPHLLALAREGTLSAAARSLGTDPTTVRRRLDALERELGARLVLRGPDGWRLTAAGERAVAAAARAESALADFSRAAAGSATEVEGRVRITTIEVLATRIIVPSLVGLRERHPRLTVDLWCGARMLDLLKGEADVAVRTVRPQAGAYRCRRLATVVERPYASRSLLERLDVDPHSVQDLCTLPVVLLLGPGDHEWTRPLGDPDVAMRSTSATAALQAVRAGLGAGMLADVLADPDPELVRLEGLPVAKERELWLVCPEDLADVARVRAVLDHLVEIVPARASGPAGI